MLSTGGSIEAPAAAGASSGILAAARSGAGGSGADAAFVDADFAADDSSLGSAAEVSLTFTSDSGPDRKVAVPVLWRPPHLLADENGNFSPDAAAAGTGFDPVAQLAAYRAGPAGAALRAAAATSSYKAPPASDVAFLAEQLGRKPGFARSGFGGGAGAAALRLPTAAHPWVFKRGRYQCEDVAQGQLGVCWFVSALSLVAQREELIGRLFPAGPLIDALRAAGEPVPPAAADAATAGDHSAAAASLAAVTVPLHPRNLYQVRLCVDGLWRVVTVDGRIPANGYTGKACYTSSFRRQVWVAIVEKAAAKVVGSYGGLASGTVGEGLRLLTGAPVMSLFLRTDESDDQLRERHAEEWKAADHDAGAASGAGAAAAARSAAASVGAGAGAGGLLAPASATTRFPWEYDLGSPPPAAVLDSLWVRLLSWHEAGFLMGASCSCPEAYSDDVERAVPDPSVWAALVHSHKDACRRLGLHMNHAYSVLQVLQDPAPGSDVRLVKIRNPHATGRRSSDGGPPNSWAGAWCDGHGKWAAHPALRDVCGPHFQEDTGVFWMSLHDFATYFHRIDVAMVRGGVHNAGAGSASSSATASAATATARGGAGAGTGAGAAAMPRSHAPAPSLPAWSVVRARLPLPSTQHGVYSLRVVPQAPDGAATEVDIVVTDLPNTDLAAAGGVGAGAGAAADSSPRGDVRYRRRRAGDAKPPHDLAALVVEELSRGAAAALAAARSEEIESRRRRGLAYGADAAIARVDSHGQPTGPKDPRGEVLALEASGMRYVTGGKRSLDWEATASAFLDGRPILPAKAIAGGARSSSAGWAPAGAPAAALEPRVYHVLPFSLNTYAQTSDAPSFAIVELHHATNRPLQVEVVQHPPSLGSSFVARAVMCRTLTLGDAMEWEKSAGSAASAAAAADDDGRYSGLVLVSHGDGAGKLIVAANRSPLPTDFVQVRHEFTPSTTWDSVAVSRPVASGAPHATEDVVAPLSVQVLQALSHKPLTAGRGHWSWGSRMATSRGGRIGTDGAPPHRPPVTEAVAGGGALHVQLPFVVQ